MRHPGKNLSQIHCSIIFLNSNSKITESIMFSPSEIKFMNTNVCICQYLVFVTWYPSLFGLNGLCVFNVQHKICRWKWKEWEVTNSQSRYQEAQVHSKNPLCLIVCASNKTLEHIYGTVQKADFNFANKNPLNNCNYCCHALKWSACLAVWRLV